MWVKPGFISVVALILTLSGSDLAAHRVDLPGQGACSLIVVDQEDLRAAMAAETNLGYDATATTNVGRYFAGVIFRLARKAQSDDPNGMPLLIRHDDWFTAFLNVHGLEENTAPLYLTLAHQHQQDVLVDYNVSNVVKEVKTGGSLEIALNILLSWPDSEDAPDKYSFVDTLSSPTLRVTNKRVLRYRLLDFGDVIVFDEIKGITGRPESGLLGALFKLIGEGRVTWSRFTVSDDGLLLIRAQAKKAFFKITTTVSVEPDGVARKGLPEARPDLVPLEDRLKEDFEIKYHDWRLSDTLKEACPAV